MTLVVQGDHMDLCKLLEIGNAVRPEGIALKEWLKGSLEAEKADQREEKM